MKGFLSHCGWNSVLECGWNSVLESICAGVPILAWPMMAEQPLNAKMVEEELKMGLRIDGPAFRGGGGGGGLVRWEEVEIKVRELMDGEGGEEKSE
ncbi:hypothetical protein SAY87_023035 [Trapa incisa]|uniref:Uncharacterized protein n=1 Tax=Trapa incisa TaxID=236973 RepID=A0AAN7Q6F3_9MYRT|nr:hypothetical protein SAY87_023035 [Trapa incisa]